MQHPARTIPFEELAEGLEEARYYGYVTENEENELGLALYSYTDSCTYEKHWNDYTRLARGLVLDHRAKKVVATPFPKFFNAFEHGQDIPNLPFTAYDKVDGSLIILFFHNGQWHTTTKGAWNTIQSNQAYRLLPDHIKGPDPVNWINHDFVPGATYLLEYVGPENRIIIDYPEPQLHLLGGYWEDGTEIEEESLVSVANVMGWEVVRQYHFNSFSEILEQTEVLPASREGFVVKFSDGSRMKIKGNAYCRLHSLVSRITPLGVWEIMHADEPIDDVKEKIPEEFWKDFDDIYFLLQNKICDLQVRVTNLCAPLHGLTDKEVGLRLSEFPTDLRKFIFAYRKFGGAPIGADYEKYCKMLVRAVRPDANHLPGYSPSYMMGRVTEES